MKRFVLFLAVLFVLAGCPQPGPGPDGNTSVAVDPPRLDFTIINMQCREHKQVMKVEQAENAFAFGGFAWTPAPCYAFKPGLWALRAGSLC